MSNLPRVMVQVAHGSPTSFSTIVFLMLRCIMSLEALGKVVPVPGQKRDESCCCPREEGSEGWGSRLHRQGTTTWSQHHMLTWALFL